MTFLSRTAIAEAAHWVREVVPATPQYVWPQLCRRVGATVWLKHENHAPTGSFKVRGGVSFARWLRETHPEVTGIVTATRGNHGQSQARAASAAGLDATIVVPHGNSAEKNAAMEAFGARLVVQGADFDQARAVAAALAREHGYFMVPAFHREIVRGVASYALELFSAAPDLDRVYVPIGCGSGICGLIATRDALGLKTEIVGVVSSAAPAAKWSFESGQITESDTAATFADGMAVRVPVPEAFAIYRSGADHIVAVSDDEIAEAIRILFREIHHVAEGAGAAAFAALLKEREQVARKAVAVILTGANIDTPVFARVLSGQTPTVA